MPSSLTIWTIGHSTHSTEEFVAMLRAFNIEMLADVRRFPGSRRYPQFNASELSQELGLAGIDYIHFPELGGRREARPDSHNTAWRNVSFRGYADYMETPEFQAAIERLTKLATKQRTAIMCAEAVWWRCHRGLISDYLKASGVEVIHILGATKSEEHPYTSAAHLEAGRLSYAADGNLTLF